MNVVLVAPEFEYSNDWVEAVENSGLPIKIVRDGELPDDAITAAIVDSPPNGRLRDFHRLKIILSLSAGVDSLLSDTTLPNVPLVRLVNAEMVALMREYIAYQVLRLHRNFRMLEDFQEARQWVWLSPSQSASAVRVSFLGLGQLGRASANALLSLGFQVSGWSRTPKNEVGIRCYSGPDGLQALLRETNILVCLLPLTMSTQGILNADLFSRLPKGASLINVSRGECQNETDLIVALNDGHLSHATLDVFATEPLPADHPLWRQSQVTITPHMAAYPSAESFVEPIVASLRQLLSGARLDNIVNRSEGY